MDTTAPTETTGTCDRQTPALRLANVMHEARRFAIDVRLVAETTSGCGDHQRLTRHHRLAEERKVLDPDYIDTLRAIIASLDRRIARSAEVPTPTGPTLDEPLPLEAQANSAAATLMHLRVRAHYLLGAIDKVLDDVMAEHAIAELRFFPCFNTALASISAADLASSGPPGYSL